MYHELRDTDSFSSEPQTHPSVLHEEISPPLPSNKMELKHTVSADDSLYGLALKYDQSIQNIMNLNNMSSETIYPGQILRILINKNGSFVEEAKRNSMEEDPEDLAKTENETEKFYSLEAFLQEEDINSEYGLKCNEILPRNFKYFEVNCEYCTSSGEIMGQFTVFKKFIAFHPDQNSFENKLRIRTKKMDKFRAYIDLRDIVSVEIKMTEALFIQIQLNSVGAYKNETYCLKVKEYKSLSKAMASCFFKLPLSEPLKNKIPSLSKKINSLIETKRQNRSDIDPSLTHLPFYDIISQKETVFIENRNTNDVHPAKIVQVKKIPEEYLPRTKDHSTILNKIQFHELIEAMPPVLRICNWHLIYATMKHGSCFEVLFRLIGDHDFPNLLVIRDWKGNVFGAYFNEGWKRRKLFYGAGETFLYTFKSTDDIKVYYWTRKNNYFMLTNGETGICVGAGDYFGLYVHPDLTKGYTFPSDTFDNDFLTDEKDFTIERLEIWMVDYDEVG